MILMTIFLITLSVMFSRSSATEFFGSNLYLVKNDVFELIKAPSVVLGERAEPADLGAGDIVIFVREDGYKLIGEVIERDEALVITDESGEEYEVSEYAVIARAVRTSRTMGIIVSFAISPAGVLVLVIVPCFCLIFLELLKPLFRKRRDSKEVVPVNKQDETPTYIPTETSNEPVSESVVSKPEPRFDLDKPAAPFAEEKPAVTGSTAALKAYKSTLAHTLNLDDEMKKPQLFIQGERPRSEKPPVFNPQAIETLKNATAPVSHKKKPLSSVKLAEVIANVNAQKAQANEEEGNA
jgi:hypothetical protein